jgi:hypothetical protein
MSGAVGKLMVALNTPNCAEPVETHTVVEAQLTPTKLEPEPTSGVIIAGVVHDQVLPDNVATASISCPPPSWPIATQKFALGQLTAVK